MPTIQNTVMTTSTTLPHALGETNSKVTPNIAMTSAAMTCTTSLIFAGSPTTSSASPAISTIVAPMTTPLSSIEKSKLFRIVLANAMYTANPPSNGVGAPWIFLAFGTSNTPILIAESRTRGVTRYDTRKENDIRCSHLRPRANR